MPGSRIVVVVLGHVWGLGGVEPHPVADAAAIEEMRDVTGTSSASTRALTWAATSRSGTPGRSMRDALQRDLVDQALEVALLGRRLCR